MSASNLIAPARIKWPSFIISLITELWTASLQQSTFRSATTSEPVDAPFVKASATLLRWLILLPSAEWSQSLAGW